jgi:hypothetical protein
MSPGCHCRCGYRALCHLLQLQQQQQQQQQQQSSSGL